MELRDTKIHETAELKISITEKCLEESQRKGLVSNGEWQERDWKR